MIQCLLFLALLGFGGDRPTQADLDLQYAVESWVQSVEPSRLPPEPFRHMIDDLGNDCFLYRQAASKRLESASRGNIRWLFWGRRYKDPEIRVRCNAILRRVARCPSCDGFGACIVFRPDDKKDYPLCRRCGKYRWFHDPENIQPCAACDGVGTAWRKGAFD